jgi:ribosomal-protein-serine acetyltransferase
VIPISWAIDEQTILRTLTLDDADVVFRAVDDNRDRLRPYMPWEQTTRSPADVRAFIERSLASVTDRDANGIWVGEEYVGNVGLRVDVAMHAGELGYWNVRGVEGSGLITKACRRLIDYGFGERQLHRIEIHAAADNRRSRAVAERLGFTCEASMRDGHRHPDGTYVDQVVYGLLEHEWPAP